MYTFFVSHSFIHKPKDNKIKVSPINLAVNCIDSKVYFSITYAFTDLSSFDNLKYNKMHFKKNKDPKLDLAFSNKKESLDLVYIDINKEFM